MTKFQVVIQAVLGSIVVSIPACHAGDRGSIPRQGEIFSFFWFLSEKAPKKCASRTRTYAHYSAPAKARNRPGICWQKRKIWNASRFCVSSLRRGHANLLCIVPILVYADPKVDNAWYYCSILKTKRQSRHQRIHHLHIHR